MPDLASRSIENRTACDQGRMSFFRWWRARRRSFKRCVTRTTRGVREVADRLRSAMVRMLVKPPRDPVNLRERKETAEVTMPWERVVSADREIDVFFRELTGSRLVFRRPL